MESKMESVRFFVEATAGAMNTGSMFGHSAILSVQKMN